MGIILQNNKRGNIKFEIPLPYEVEHWPDDNQIFFDYRLIALAKKKNELLDKLKNVQGSKESKFYNSILEIIILPNEELI